jgi:hypothetical protein
LDVIGFACNPTERSDMARLTQPPRSAFEDPEDREAYDAVVKRRAAMRMAADDADPDRPDMGEYWGALLNSPRMCAIAARMGTFVRTAGERPGSYAHWQREFVDQVLSADWKTNVVQKLHIPDGVAAGVRLEAVEALRFGREEELNDEERLLARYIRQVVSGTVDDETFAAIHERLGDRGIIEYTGFILWLQWIIRMMQAIGVEDPPDEEIDALIRDLREGRVAVPDFRERLA